jgi:nanoRNase/pAp phosphatase (c-di-AMP/oligoRNAs hydrolase)
MIYLVMHRRADLDAIASSYVLCKAIQFFYEDVNCKIVAPDGISETTLELIPKSLIKKLRLVENVSEDQDNSLIIFMDVGGEAPLSDYKRLLEYKQNKWLIDHHLSVKEFHEHFDKVFVDTEASSTLEIVLDAIWSDICPCKFFNKSELKLMIYAFIVETRFLHLATWRALRYVSSLLKLYGEKDRLGGFYKKLVRKPSISEKIAVLKGFLRMELYRSGDYLLAITNVSAFQNIASSKMISSGVDIVVIYSNKGKGGCKIHIRISDRVKETFKINVVNDIINIILKEFRGSGGGHSQIGNIQLSKVDCINVPLIIEHIFNILKGKGLIFSRIE